MVDFFQEGPRLGNQYLEDPALRAYLKVFMGTDLSSHEGDFKKFGIRVIDELIPHHRMCERYPPEFEEYSAWGERINKIHTHPSWTYMHRVSSQENLIGLGYSDMKNPRLVQFAKLYLFNPSSGLYMCPLAMTDGAAFLIKHFLNKDQETDEVFKRLTSNNPDDFWTSGQWMTEKHGGSDVSSATKTFAKHISGDKYELYGYKWFTSATTADVTFTLARVDGKVSLFLVKIPENLPKLKVVRLKEKMGTRQLPTSEIILEGCVGKLVSPVGQGVRFISNLMNITRLYNTLSAVSSMRRATAIARDYSYRRNAFGKSIIEHPLHSMTLFLMEIKTRGCLLLTLYAGSLLQKVERKTATNWESLTLRILTPIAKLYTGKLSSQVVKEGMECLGGVGYMENSGFPNLLRDTEVYSIWEGTTNILSLDMIRVIQKSQDFSLSFLKTALQTLSSDIALQIRIENVSNLLSSQHLHRKLAFELGHIIISGLFDMISQKTLSKIDEQAGKYWKTVFHEDFTTPSSSLIKELAENYYENQPTGHGDYNFDRSPRYKL